MDIILDHTIVPAQDKEGSARFFAGIFGLTYEGAHGHFAPVRVNDSLTLDFDDGDGFQSHHYAFFVDDGQFDSILGRVKEAGIPYGSGPRDRDNYQLNTRKEGRGFYFDDPNGHILELMTRR